MIFGRFLDDFGTQVGGKLEQKSKKNGVRKLCKTMTKIWLPGGDGPRQCDDKGVGLGGSVKVRFSEKMSPKPKSESEIFEL